MGLGFWALYARRHFRWTRLEASQLVLGLAIPFLLADHVIGSRVSFSQFGIDKGYAEELLKFWVRSPVSGALQATSLLIVWIYGCLGLHFWLRLKPFYPRVTGLLLSIAVLLPALALLGFYQGGKQTLEAVEDPAWRAPHIPRPDRNRGPERRSARRSHADPCLPRRGAGLDVLRQGRPPLARAARGSIRLTYPDRTIRAPRGFSVLEASLINNIPHAHVCGGRGRCSTCRIRVLSDISALPAPSAAEQAVLERVHAAPGVRLACQLRPTEDIAFVPMLSPHATTVDAYRSGSAYSGVERYVVIMFVDMRGSSRLAEGRLPFDTVFVINQFLSAVSSAVLGAGGEPNQILGDGLLALFGMGARPETACRQAIVACAAIAARVETLNSALAYALLEPIRFGIGIHAGVTIAGNIGYERHAQFTVIGDAVNVAARLEEMTKAFGCEVVMSEEVYERAGFGPDDLPAHDVAPRGREAGMKARSVVRAADLAGFLAAQAPAAS